MKTKLVLTLTLFLLVAGLGASAPDFSRSDYGWVVAIYELDHDVCIYEVKLIHALSYTAPVGGQYNQWQIGDYVKTTGSFDFLAWKMLWHTIERGHRALLPLTVN